MIFGRLNLEDAEGAILAHAVDAGPLGRLKKGTYLDDVALSALRKAGETTVLAAKLEAGDMPENEAAATIAQAIKGNNTEVRPPFTGRANLVARQTGIAVLNRDLLHEINEVDPSITIATVKAFDKVEIGQLLATIKIIPFSAPIEYVKAVQGFAELAQEPLLEVAPFTRKKIGVISTRLPGTTDKLIEKSEKVLADRLANCGNTISIRETVPHHEDDLAPAIARLKTQGCMLILIFGASAITDPHDVVPNAINAAGGYIDHFGMPVDPGNLLLLGHMEDCCIIGLPGCTRSPRLNGFDWVLQRILADIPVTAHDIMQMGEGGLLKEIASRPQPRRQQITETAQRPKVAALLLAAGQSRRMGTDNKLLALIDGKPMVRRVAEALEACTADETLIVTGHDADEVIKTLWDLSIRSVQNPDFANGLSTSLKLGFELLHDKFDGILVCLGDMPFVSAHSLNKIIEAFDPDEGRAIIVPTQNGKRGNPALISSRFWDEIRDVTGDMGAKALISANEHVVETVEIDSAEIFTDIDTPEILAAVTGQAFKKSE